MKVVTLIRYAFVALCLSVSANTSAGIITFDLTSDNGKTLGKSFSFEIDGYTLNVMAFDANGNNVKIHSNTDGIGVKKGLDGNRLGSSGSGLGEYLVFELVGADFFNFNVIFPSATSKWSGNQFEQTDTAFVDVGGKTLASLSGQMYNWQSGQVTGNTFMIRAGDLVDGNGFRINSIQMSVPEPSSLAILSLAMLGLGIRRWKR